MLIISNFKKNQYQLIIESEILSSYFIILPLKKI